MFTFHLVHLARAVFIFSSLAAIQSSNKSISLVLTQAVPSTSNPRTELDLIGDGSDSIDENCKRGLRKKPVCECEYRFNSPASRHAAIISPVIYQEANLLRCSTKNLPESVTSLEVSVHILNTNSSSNRVKVYLHGLDANWDSTDSRNYIQPVRYQCRDVIQIPYLWDPSIYDPVQSENPRLSYPLNFYASNLAEAVSSYSHSSHNWQCPPNLSPDRYLSSEAKKAFYSNYNIDLKLQSRAPLPGGGQMIYPPNGAIDRSTFYLAQSKKGPFQVAVNSLLSPGVITTERQNGPHSLGYGVAPARQASGREYCDTSLPIPSGYHWMKLWLWRASLPQRYYVTPGRDPGILDVGRIACNPGSWHQTANWNASLPFSSCGPDLAEGGSNVSMNNIDFNRETYLGSGAHTLADRVLDTRQCMRLEDPSGIHCGSHPGAQCDSSQRDHWLASESPPQASPPVGCSAHPLLDPLQMCPISEAKPPETQADNFGIGNLDADSRFDFIFVVTPPGIHTQDMMGFSNNALPYQPLRVSSPEITNYSLKLHDIGTLGDPPAEEPSSGPSFPVCVIQPDQERGKYEN